VRGRGGKWAGRPIAPVAAHAEASSVTNLLFDVYAAGLVTGMLWAVRTAFRLGAEKS